LVNAFDGPARQAFVVEMVGREDLPNAIALNSMMFNSARIIGPAMGGVLLATVGADWCFLINGFSFLAVIAGLLAMRLPPLARHEHLASPWEQLKSGLQYMNAHRDMLALILLSIIFSVFGMSYTTELPAFVEKVLHQGAAGYGSINAASGMGAVVGAFLIANMGNRTRRGLWLTAANIGFPLVLTAFAYTTSYPLSLLESFGLGLGFMLQFTLINTLLQTRVEDRMRGRVLALYTLSFFGFAPFGNLAIGWVAEAVGLSPTIAISALIALLLSLVVLRMAPFLRRL
jgi:predicted MFS family arabinose efflux permease